METVLGTDVSVYQGPNLDYPAIAASGVRFLIGKATEHTGYVDPLFERHVTGAEHARMLTGSYHFFRPEVDPEQQARKYFEVAGARVDLPPVLDFETLRGISPKEAVRRAFRFVEATEGLWSKPCVIYTFPAFWIALGNPALREFGARPLWIAHQGVASPKVPRPWQGTGWAMWQFDGNGGCRLPGGVDADFNLFRGTEEELHAFARITVASCTEPAPEFSHA